MPNINKSQKSVGQVLGKDGHNTGAKRPATIAESVRSFPWHPECNSATPDGLAILGILSELRARDRDVLQRFYVKFQTPEVIASETGVAVEQVRALKARVRGRFAAIRCAQSNESSCFRAESA